MASSVYAFNEPNSSSILKSNLQKNWFPYMQDVEQKIKKNWKPPRSPKSAKIVVSVNFWY